LRERRKSGVVESDQGHTFTKLDGPQKQISGTNTIEDRRGIKKAEKYRMGYPVLYSNEDEGVCAEVAVIRSSQSLRVLCRVTEVRKTGEKGLFKYESEMNGMRQHETHRDLVVQAKENRP
jgi:hypothetical protein